jgi:hypothetical protein
MTRTTTKAKTTKASQKIAAKAKATKAVQAGEDEEEEDLPRSVVKSKYKAIYRSRENSMKGRNCADWLAQQLAALVLDDAKKLQIGELQAICRANGAKDDYDNRSKGWEGRMRMTLGLRLRPIVATQGFLAVPNGRKTEKHAAPAAFIAAYKK